jgi:hypothetical protein
MEVSQVSGVVAEKRGSFYGITYISIKISRLVWKADWQKFLNK